jgi:hypothetical protein
MFFKFALGGVMKGNGTIKNLTESISHTASAIYHPCNISQRAESFKQNNENESETETSIKFFITKGDGGRMRQLSSSFKPLTYFLVHPQI